MSGKVRFVLGGSGHIAGVINPPTQEASQLDIIDPVHRLLLLPLLEAIDAEHRQHSEETLTVVLPE